MKKLAFIFIIGGFGVLMLSIIVVLGIVLPLNDFDLEMKLPYPILFVVIMSILAIFLGIIFLATHYRHDIIAEVKRLYNN
ncbi:MAG: hypothetical protein AABY22_07600 [Nanoarchaeota archaeon]